MADCTCPALVLAPPAQTKVLGDDVVPTTGYWRAAESRARPETRMAENRFFVERRPDELLGESHPLIKMGSPDFWGGASPSERCRVRRCVRYLAEREDGSAENRPVAKQPLSFFLHQ